MPKLLDLHKYHLSESAKRKIAESTSLQWLRLPTDAAADDIKWISEITSLRGLSLNGVDSRGADLSPLGALQNLQYLNLSMSKLSEEDFKSLPRLPKLEVLRLEGVATDAILEHLASLKLPKLKKVNLAHSVLAVTDRGVSALCTQYDLTFLSLFRVRSISADSVEVLGSEKQMRLLDVGLSGVCPTPTPYDVNAKRLEKLLPNCSVLSGD